ncbi:MAG: Gfo/Idh/MocA family oxidoreductase [Candidatus Riflebacteria bacterium]|nr:Gfo/Idh/MocA family oxidoreductase [Candidatus Riflebacteria bacterium]
MKKNFALIGAGGYIAPRHLQAIKETGNNLLVAVDKSDSVGILDRYFYDVDFFTEFERFDRHIDKLRRQGEEKRIHFVSICSPNYLHDSHIRFALRNEADAICEKPLVMNPWNLDFLSQLEQETGKRIYTILQLRIHPAIVAFKERIDALKMEKKADVVLTYITSRGKWYHYSWKGDLAKSGGIATNIGIHFFDILLWIFGRVERQEVHVSTSSKASGYLELEKARVRWFLSIDRNDLTPEAIAQGKNTFRSLTLDGKEVEFSEGFTDLHTQVYKRILEGKGFGIEDAVPSINLVHHIRNTSANSTNSDHLHPLFKA